MTTVINIHKDSMFMTGVMTCLWQCHVSLMHTPSNKVLPNRVRPCPHLCLFCPFWPSPHTETMFLFKNKAFWKRSPKWIHL